MSPLYHINVNIFAHCSKGKKMNDRLKYYRIQNNLTQAYVADILNISRRTMISIEQGKSKLTPEQLTILADLYGVSVESIIKGENSNTNIIDMNKAFSDLSAEDQKEVIDFINFKRDNSRKKNSPNFKRVV